MSEGKEPRPGMACDGWANCADRKCSGCNCRQEDSCKSCWEKTLDAFRAEGGLRALMRALGRTCYDCDAYIVETGDCAEICKCVGDDDFCSFWVPFEARTETEDVDESN